MFKRIIATTLAVMSCFLWNTAPALSSSHLTYSITSVPTGTPTYGAGWNSGVTLANASFVRLSADGEITFAYGPCGKIIEPQGCGANTNSTQMLNTGTLEAAFTGPDGSLLSNWLAVGSGTTLNIPQGAVLLLLHIHGIYQHGQGSFHVITDVLPQNPALRGALNNVQTASSFFRSLQAIRRNTPSLTQQPTATQSRSDVQYTMRRFGWAGTPEQVTQIMSQGGVSAWLTPQLNPSSVNDPNILNYVTHDITRTPAFEPDYSHREYQMMVNSLRVVQEKAVIYWLKQFSIDLPGSGVSTSGGDGRSGMQHFVDVLHRDALGNFTTLMEEVAKEPNMLIWLTNLNNNGADPTQPPDENFARELMQLYTIGVYQLNPDGTQVLDSSGNPVTNYTETDVKQLALALSGFTINPSAYTLYGTYPATVPVPLFKAALHPTANSYRVMGTTILDPGGAQCTWSVNGGTGPCIFDNAIKSITHLPTCWAFQSKKLIQEYATEYPSPAFVQRVTAVWGQNVDSPTQIATVLQAIANDPEFLASKYTTVKDPIDFILDATHALHGTQTVSLSMNPSPIAEHFYETFGGMQEDPTGAPNVFSFYPPGDRESIWTNFTRVKSFFYTSYFEADLTTAYSQSTTSSDELLDLSQFANSTNGEAMADYLLDALVDGGSPALKTTVVNIINNNPLNLKYAVVAILQAPEYEVE